MSNYSNITLYRNTKFYPHQNYKIDSITDFLNAFLSADKKVFERQQYWKINGIEKEFKLEIPQSQIKNIHEFNYAKVEMINSVEEVEYLEWTLYYFVTSFEWLSKNTIKLRMRIDTLNTFLDMLTFHPKTFIEREHIDRWNYDSYIKDDDNQKITLLRNIPELPEGLNPQKYGYSIIGDNEYSLELINKDNALFVSPSEDRREFWIAHYLGVNDTEGLQIEHNPLIFTIGTSEFALPYVKNHYSGDQNAYQMTNITNIDASSNNNQKLLILPYAPSESLIEWRQYTENNPFTTDNTFSGIRFKYEIDSEDIYLNGILLNFNKKLTYNITPIRISRYLIDSSYYGGTGKNFDNVMKNLFTTEKDYETLISDIVENGFFKNLGYANESASFSSEFLSLRFYYGGDNAYDLSLEDYKYNGSKSLSQLIAGTNGFISISYFFSIQIDNSIYFKFDTNLGAFNINYKDESKGIMITPITTQLPILNDAYLNYLRNGYNYDIKIRDIGLREGARHLGESGLSFLLSQLPASIFNAKNFITFGGTSLTKTLGWAGNEISSAFDLYDSSLKSKLEIEKNLAQLKGSKLGIEQVSGGIDKVLKINPNYKLGFTIMTSRRSWWKYLDDYFYYFGSKSQYYGIPTHNNRCLFDYLKCKAEFINRNSIPNSDALNDIINRLNSGVTFIHKFMNTWTFDSDYKENIEVALYNIINPSKKEKKRV